MAKKLTVQERIRRQAAANRAWNLLRKAKPFTVWPADREGPQRFATYEKAETYAKRALKRTSGSQRVTVERDGIPMGTCFIDWRDRIVVDLTPEGAALV